MTREKRKEQRGEKTGERKEHLTQRRKGAKTLKGMTTKPRRFDAFSPRGATCENVMRKKNTAEALRTRREQGGEKTGNQEKTPLAVD